VIERVPYRAGDVVRADTRRPRHLRGSGEVVGRPRVTEWPWEVWMASALVLREGPVTMAVGPWAFPMHSPAYAVLE